MTALRAIDVHTHLLPPEVPRWAQKFGYGGFVHLEPIAGSGTPACRARMVRSDGTPFRDVEENLWDGPARLKECDVRGVGVQVLSTVPAMFSYFAKPAHGLEVARFLNDHLADVVRAQPRRFAGLGTLPLQSPELSVRELERCVGELGLAGVQIGTHVGELNLDAPALFAVFERASQLGAAVFVHPWDMRGQEMMANHWGPWLVGMPMELAQAICAVIFGGVLERLPKLRMMFAHGGGAFAGTLGRITHGFQARPDLVAVDNPHPPQRYLNGAPAGANRLYADSLVHDARALRLVLETFGHDRVAVGSDYPFPLGEEVPGTLIRSQRYPPSVEARLLAGTALEWLGRRAEEFDL